MYKVKQKLNTCSRASNAVHFKVISLGLSVSVCIAPISLASSVIAVLVLAGRVK